MHVTCAISNLEIFVWTRKISEKEFWKNKNEAFTLTYFSNVSVMLFQQCSSSLAREIRKHILATRKVHVQGQRRESSRVFVPARCNSSSFNEPKQNRWNFSSLSVPSKQPLPPLSDDARCCNDRRSCKRASSRLREASRGEGFPRNHRPYVTTFARGNPFAALAIVLVLTSSLVRDYRGIIRA